MASATEAFIAQGTLVWVPLEQLHPNPWNPNQMDAFMYEKERESIRKFGIAAPIVARLLDGEYQIIDGENRYNILIEEDYESAPVWNLGPVDDVNAKQLTIVLNETKGSPEKQKLADLLQDLLKGSSTEELLGVLPFSREKFLELTNLPPFNWEEFEQAATTRTANTWVERIYRLPIDAATVLDRAIEQAKSGSMPDWQALEHVAQGYLDGTHQD